MVYHIIILEIVKIQKLYRKYDQIIIDIDYNKKEDKIFINNTSHIELKYVNLIIKIYRIVII